MVDAEVLVFADGEQTIIDFLEAESAGTEWAGEPIGTSVPDPRPPAFTRVLRTGGPAKNFYTDNGTFAIESWDDDEARASRRSEWNRQRILAAGRAGQMGAVTLTDEVLEYSGPTNLPDPRTGQSRYTFTHQIPMRGDSVA